MTQGNSQVTLLTSRQFANLCRTTKRTLRLYEQKGIFKAAKIDKYSNYRYFKPTQARKFLRIKLLQHFGIPLKQLKELTAKRNTEKYIQNQLKDLVDEIREKQRSLVFLQNLNNILFSKDNRIILNETFEGPFTLLVMKVEHGEYSKITGYHQELKTIAEKLDIKITGTEIVFYLSPDYRPNDTPMEIALVIGSGLPPALNLPPNISVKNFPKTKVKTFSYQGPFEYLDLIYQKLDSAGAFKTLKPFGHVFDIYNYSPSGSRYENTTRICFPISEV